MARKPVQQRMEEAQAMLAARDQAAQTPEQVREAFLCRTTKVGPVILQPFSLGILWIFEQLKHPLGEPNATGTLSIADAARAIYAFVSPEEANESLAGGLESYDAAAFELARQIAPAWFAKIVEAITRILAEGLATIPGGSESDPTETGS
jgi:hypothetical protein